MGRRVGAKRAGQAPAKRRKSSSLLRSRAPRQPELLGKEGGGGGGGGGCASGRLQYLLQKMPVTPWEAGGCTGAEGNLERPGLGFILRF